MVLHLALTAACCRGILFHGEPGTGKTLIARALAGACAQHSPVSVSFFSRKGADCLGKFLGEAERTLRLLFDEVQLQQCVLTIYTASVQCSVAESQSEMTHSMRQELD